MVLDKLKKIFTKPGEKGSHEGMFCYQCQEAARNEGCTIRGVCGKQPATAKLQDLLIHAVKGTAVYSSLLREGDEVSDEYNHWLMNSLFMTITNSNFDDTAIIEEIKKAYDFRNEFKKKAKKSGLSPDKKYSTLLEHEPKNREKMLEAAEKVGVLRTANEDIRSLREMILYGLKGMSAYGEHAFNLGKEKPEIYAFMEKALLATDDDTLTADDMVALTLETGKYGVEVMALLDEANTSTYGHPEATEVNIGVRNNPGILISGHDLKDLKQLLDQTKDQGVDIYTHSEMLSANSYPVFKKYDHLVGNYGGSWWHQTKEFRDFNGPILFTSNCLVPPRGEAAEYLGRVYTTNSAGLGGCEHILPDENGKKDFSRIIEQAKKCPPPVEIETGKIWGGFAHNQILSVADKVVEAIKSGAIKKFFVMGGCDARMQDRKYYTEFAEKLPEDTIILTAGCAKYRYNKLPLGDIAGIPRVLDAGQCNDSYSLAVVALKLKEVFELDDINDLPIEFNIAWYEQKAVLVLLALLHLGVKNIHLGPTLPAFLSPNVAGILVEKFGITPISTAEEDVKKFMGEA